MEVSHQTIILATLIVAVFAGTTSSSPLPDEKGMVHPGNVASLSTNPPEPVLNPGPAASHFNTIHWREGQTGSFDFEATIQLASSTNDLSYAEVTRLTGVWQYVVVDCTSNHVRLFASISEPHYQKGDSRIGPMEELLKSAPALMTLSTDGSLLDLCLPKAIPQDDRNVLGMAYGWQFIVRDLGDYTASEGILTRPKGIYQSTYHRGASNQIHWSRSIPASAPSDSGTYQKVTGSDFTAVLGDSWLGTLEGTEDADVYLKEHLIVVSHSTLKLADRTGPGVSSQLKELAADKAGWSRFTASPELDLAGESVTKRLRREALADRWGNVPYSNLLKELSAVSEGPLEQIGQPLHNFGEWITVHGETGPQSILDSLRRQDTAPSLAGYLVLVLAKAKTATARRSLLEVIRNASVYSPEVQVQAMSSAAGWPDRDPELFEALRGNWDREVDASGFNIADVSLLTYASLTKSHPDARSALIEKISPWLRTDADEQKSLRALRALENGSLADAELAERARRLSETGSEGVKHEAQRYLASIGQPTKADADGPSVPLMK